MIQSLDNLVPEFIVIEDCRNSNSLRDISSDTQRRLLTFLTSSRQKPEALWDAIGHLHVLALKEKDGELAFRLAKCAQPYLGQLPPNINLVIARRAIKCFSSLALAQIPFFTTLFNGPCALKWEATNRFVINDDGIKSSSLECLLEYIQGRRKDFSDLGFLKLGWLIQHVDYLYAGFRSAPEDLRQAVITRLVSINLTPEQILKHYSMACYFQCDTLMEATFTQLTSRIQTPKELHALWELVDLECYQHLHEGGALLNKLANQIQLSPGPHDREAASWAYSKALLYGQVQWRQALASSLIDINDDFAFGYLEGTLQHKPVMLTSDLDYATTQYLLKRAGEWLRAIDDCLDIDEGKRKKNEKLTELDKDAFAYLQRFAQVARHIVEMDGPFLEGVSQKKLSWIFSKLNPALLRSVNLDGSGLSDATILHPFNNLISLSLKACMNLSELDLIDALPKLQHLDLSNCLYLKWKIGLLTPKRYLTHLLLDNVSIGSPEELSQFPKLATHAHSNDVG